jgi:phytoene desaturase
MKKYDAIIIGAGLGGLSAAAKIAHSRQKVLVIDQHYVVGGCASTFKRKKFYFDASVHLMGGCEENGLIGHFLKELGIGGGISFIEINPMYTAKIGEETFDIPANLYELEGNMCRWFPEECQGIHEVIDKIIQIGNLLIHENKTDGNKENQASMMRELANLRNVSFRDFLGSYLSNEKAISVLNTLAFYAGVSPNTLSALFMIGVLISYHNGAYYPKGSTQALANLLKDYITEQGSEVVIKRKVEKIIVKDGKVAGIVDHKGQIYESDVIISNSDMESTYKSLIGEEYLPNIYKKKFNQLKSSCSAVILYAGIKDEGQWSRNIPHELFIYPEGIQGSQLKYYHPGDPSVIPMSICCPSHADPDLAPPGYSVVTITALCDYQAIEDIRAEKGKNYILEDFLQRIEQILPGFRERMVLHELATPGTIHRFTKNQKGAMYGWNKERDQPWLAKMGPVSPIKGLYFAGHWTANIHGVYGVIKSGLQTAKTVINNRKITQ